MAAKPNKHHPIHALYLAADEIVRRTRQVMAEQKQPAGEIRLPIMMQGTDMRVTVEAGPRTAARNALEKAQLQASDGTARMLNPPDILADAQALLQQYARSLAASYQVDGQWPADPADPDADAARRDHARCLATARDLQALEGLV